MQIIISKIIFYRYDLEYNQKNKQRSYDNLVTFFARTFVLNNPF